MWAITLLMMFKSMAHVRLLQSTCSQRRSLTAPTTLRTGRGRTGWCWTRINPRLSGVWTQLVAFTRRRRHRPMHVVDDGVTYAVNDGILRRRVNVTALLKYCGLSIRCMTTHNDMVWQLLRGTPDSARHVWTFAMWRLTAYSLGGHRYLISVSAWDTIRFLSEHWQV